MVDKGCSQGRDYSWNGRQIAAQYIDKYISVNIPPQDCKDKELFSLVLRAQQHNNMATCRKATEADCQFDFAQPLSEETRLKSHDDPGNKSRFYVLKR